MVTYQELCKDQHGNRVMATVTQDNASMRVSATMFFEKKTGKRSTPVTIPRSRVMNGSESYNFLYDWGTGFDENDVKGMRDRLKDLFEKHSEPQVVFFDKADPEEAYRRLAFYIRENFTGKLKSSGEDDLSYYEPCFIKGDSGFIRTNAFDSFLNANPDLGYKRLELLRVLRLHEYLVVPNRGRSYDTNVRVGAIQVKCYQIKMPESLELPESDVTIKIERPKEKKS